MTQQSMRASRRMFMTPALSSAAVISDATFARAFAQTPTSGPRMNSAEAPISISHVSLVVNDLDLVADFYQYAL